ncbi:MAG: hypothetical protein K0Q50_3140 [Vampirovibrio sp.]|nr:hypothetical protein [Vampirovibrio sp.]
MPRSPMNKLSVMIALSALWLLGALPALCQEAADGSLFPHEEFIQINPTLPNSKLNFDDDSQESCCAKDYTPSGQPISRVNSTGSTSGPQNLQSGNSANVARSEFEKSNPKYHENGTPSYLISCERFTQMPELAGASAMPSAPLNGREGKNTLPIESYSTNVSLRPGASYISNPALRLTSSFHIETAGGSGQLQLQDVQNYSVCMAKGNNVAMVANTENGSILTYNGSDHIYLAGNNMNMLTRTGAGEDLIELYQAKPNSESGSASWTAYNIYKTALSGGSDIDTLVIKGTPVGTKWCHIGGYKIFGEYFYVVEFALPPTVTEGPRRQRVNIGESVEFVVIKGKKYRLGDFLVHGVPVDTIARSVPIGDPLPRVALRH